MSAAWVHEFMTERQVSASFVTIPLIHRRPARPARDAARLSGGAMWMTERDATRLLIAAPASQLVKNSSATLTAFAKLEALGDRKHPDRHTTLEDHIVETMQRIIERRDDLPSNYIRGASPEPAGPLALTFLSGDPGQQHLVAIARRHFVKGGSSAVSFASADWARPVLTVAEYALRAPNVGLVQARHVTTWALAEIALSL